MRNSRSPGRAAAGGSFQKNVAAQRLPPQPLAQPVRKEPRAQVLQRFHTGAEHGPRNSGALRADQLLITGTPPPSAGQPPLIP
jgi:hypothetical protein